MEVRPRIKLTPKLLSINQCFSPATALPTSASSPDKSYGSRSPHTKSLTNKFSSGPKTPKFKHKQVSYDQIKPKVETRRNPSTDKTEQDKSCTSFCSVKVMNSPKLDSVKSQEIPYSESGVDIDINKTFEITDHKLLADSIRKRALMIEGLEKKITWNEKRRVKILQIEQEKYVEKKVIDHNHRDRLKEQSLRQQVSLHSSEIFRRESNMKFEQFRESKSKEARNDRMKTQDEIHRSRHSSVIKQKIHEDIKERNKREADLLRESFVEFHKTLKRRDRELKRDEAHERNYQAVQDARYNLKSAESYFKRVQSSLQIQLKLTSD